MVTAQKREERLQDVPISIAVLGGDALDKSIDRGVTEALSNVAGVFSSVTNRAGSGTAVIAIRGVSAADVGPGTTAYYLDGTAFGTAQFAVVPDANPYDLDRVEVLRGPQGTLYGASALNGVVRVLTKAPNFEDLEFKSRASLQSTDHGSESYSADAAFNMPLIQDKLAARLVVGYQDQGGWIDKPLLGKKDVNDLQKTNMRLKVAAKPIDNLSVGFTAWLSRTDTGGPQSSVDGGFTNSSIKPANHPEYVGFDESGSLDFDSYSLDLGYDASVVAVKSTTSYFDYKTQGSADMTYTNFNIIDPYAPRVLRDGPGGGSRVFTEELLLSSVGEGSWRWTLGSMYRRAQDNEVADLDPTTADNVYFVRSTSIAVFGELTRLFADGRFELTAGLRYFRDKVLTDETARSTVPAQGGLPIGSSIEDTFEKTTPRVVLTWHPSNDSTLYASYAKGFRSGLAQGLQVADLAQAFGLNIQAADPDTLTNYEIGGKASALDGRLNFETAVYYMDWQDPQQDSALLTGLPPPNNLVPIFLNGESLSGIGVDFSLMYAPVESLVLGLNASWNDLTYDEAIAGTLVPVLFPKGGRRPDSPETTAGANIAYTMKLGSSGYRGRLSASANYTSEKIVGVNPLSAIQTKADAMTLVRGGFTLEAPEHWSVSLYVDNATDENGLQRSAFAQTYAIPGFPPAPAPNYGPVIRPRTYGLQLEYRY